MATFLKNLLGNGLDSEELSAELRAILSEMETQRAEFQSLVHRAGESGEHLEKITTIGNSVRQVENQLGALERLVPQIAVAQDQTESLSRTQRRAETQLSNVNGEADRLRSQVDELGHKLDTALLLKNDLSGFLELEAPFKTLRSETETLSEQLRHLSEGYGSIRQKHEDLDEANKRTISRVDSFDADHQRVSTSLADLERRISTITGQLEGLSQVADGVPDATHQLATLKALTDQVTQKIASLEQQRDAVDRAIDQATNLNNLIRQIDAGMLKQEDQARALGEYQTRAEELKTLHGKVLERSSEITAHQHRIDEREQATKQELTALREEARRSADRFEMESRGLDAVSERISDLRGSLTNFEERFRTLDHSNQSISEIRAKAEQLTAQMSAISGEVTQLSEQAERVRMVRVNVEQLDQLVEDMTHRVKRIEEKQPSVDTALRDLAELNGSHEAIRDALEQTRAAHSDLAHMRDAQNDTEAWLKSVEQTLGTLRNQLRDLNTFKPTVESVRRQVDQVLTSTKSIESRRQVVDEMQRQFTSLSTLSTQLDQRSKELLGRMDSADERFTSLDEQSTDAEQTSKLVSSTSTAVNELQHRVGGVDRVVTELEDRAENLSGLSDRVRHLGKELDQRQTALDSASEHLERASTLRQESANLADELDAKKTELTATLATAENRAVRVTEMADDLDNRTTNLRFFEKRMSQFEDHLSKWESVETDVERALEHAVARQSTVTALHNDLKRMFEMSERTANDVQAITSAQQTVSETRAQLDDVMARIDKIDETSDQLEKKNRQIERAEARLARVDAMVMDMQSTLETLQSQKAVMDAAIEKAGSLSFQMRQADSLIETLREERGYASNRPGASSTKMPPKREDPPQQDMPKAG